MMGFSRVFLRNNEAVWFSTPDQQAGEFKTFVQNDQFIGAFTVFGDTGNFIRPVWIDETGDIVRLSNVALNGTTGEDGKVTISRSDDKIYLENRRGSLRTFICQLSFNRNLIPQ
jgi:hypothetical protein